MVTIVCWNINKKSKPWNELLKMDADIALLQEVNLGDVPASVEVSPHMPWPTYGYDRWPMVVKLSDKVNVEWFKPVNSAQVVVAEDEIAMSDFYTIAAARVTPFSNQQPSGEPFIVFSMYARWLYPHPSAKQTAPRKKGAGRINIYSDTSAHRIISDIAAFIGHTNPASHRILAATVEHVESQQRRQPDGLFFSRMDVHHCGERAPRGGSVVIEPDDRRLPYVGRDAPDAPDQDLLLLRDLTGRDAKVARVLCTERCCVSARVHQESNFSHSAEGSDLNFSFNVGRRHEVVRFEVPLYSHRRRPGIIGGGCFWKCRRTDLPFGTALTSRRSCNSCHVSATATTSSL